MHLLFILLLFFLQYIYNLFITICFNNSTIICCSIAAAVIPITRMILFYTCLLIELIESLFLIIIIWLQSGSYDNYLIKQQAVFLLLR